MEKFGCLFQNREKEASCVAIKLICHEWYHGTCVGESAEDALQIDMYTCPECSALLV